MRHVSQTHRVALDWLFDRINLDPKIQIKYVDTTNQLADMLTKGNFTRDKWNHFLRLFINSMNLSMFSYSCFFFQLKNPKTMSKRWMQEIKPGEELVLAKPISVVSVNQSPIVDLGFSYSPGNDEMPSWNSDLTSIEKSRRDVNQRLSTEKSEREVQNRLTETRLTHHNLQILITPQKKMNRPEDDQMLDHRVNVIIW